MSEFIKYLKDNQHSPSCTRAEAFRLGQRSQQAKIERLEKQVEAALACIDQAKDGYYGFSSEGGDTDNLVKDLEKALRGAND